MMPEQYYYETGTTETGAIGPGIVRTNLFTTTNKEKALSAFGKDGRNYLMRSRVIMELNGIIRRKSPNKNARICELYDEQTGRWKKV